MLEKIYYGLIIFISIYSLHSYIYRDSHHTDELQRIDLIENRINRKNKIINHYRLNTIPCHIANLINPRQCYEESKRECSWCVLAARCNKI